ncbi:hypothetical protein, partial [Mycolicibacterium wolinskyi]|uniref:hypothetical protein n=1 Tax=Mycolicibacterium wolinskyi TaxID=59750 RepID=UPI001A99B98E
MLGQPGSMRSGLTCVASRPTQDFVGLVTGPMLEAVDPLVPRGQPFVSAALDLDDLVDVAHVIQQEAVWPTATTIPSSTCGAADDRAITIRSPLLPDTR